MKKILIIAGTRPNFIKITQFKRVASKFNSLEFKIVHTGQHYDDKMADVFFKQFDLTPDFFLNISSGTPATQIAEIMLALEKLINEYKPDLIMVPGDVNSTLAAAITANKMGKKFAHIESGLRSFDETMPEEHNRILTDNLADYLFVTEQSGIDNLIKEGKEKKKIFFVGNTMIDTMIAFQPQIDSSDILSTINVEKNKFVLMTMHRPSTVDSTSGLLKLIALIENICKRYKIVFPMHPRTEKNLKRTNLYIKLASIRNLIIVEPLGYFPFQKLIKECKFIITDSGGIQEESTFLKIPCLTLRPNTERPSTISIGTNELIPFDISIINDKIDAIESGTFKTGSIPPMWDGKATERIAEVLSKVL